MQPVLPLSILHRKFSSLGHIQARQLPLHVAASLQPKSCRQQAAHTHTQQPCPLLLLAMGLPSNLHQKQSCAFAAAKAAASKQLLGWRRAAKVQGLQTQKVLRSLNADLVSKFVPHCIAGQKGRWFLRVVEAVPEKAVTRALRGCTTSSQVIHKPKHLCE